MLEYFFFFYFVQYSFMWCGCDFLSTIYQSLFFWGFVFLFLVNRVRIAVCIFDVDV